MALHISVSIVADKIVLWPAGISWGLRRRWKSASFPLSAAAFMRDNVLRETQVFFSILRYFPLLVSISKAHRQYCAVLIAFWYVSYRWDPSFSCYWACSQHKLNGDVLKLLGHTKSARVWNGRVWTDSSVYMVVSFWRVLVLWLNQLFAAISSCTEVTKILWVVLFNK